MALRPASLLPHIDYIVQLVGIEHAAIGLDYCYDDGISDRPDGMDPNYWWPVEAGYDPVNGLSGRYIAPEGFPELVEGLSQRGYTTQDITAILRDNLLRLIQRVWH